MLELTIAGAGTGSISQLTQQVRDAVAQADVICASRRFAGIVPGGKKFIELKSFAETFDVIAQESGQVLILVSGDPGVYSLLPIVKKRFAGTNITVLPGISSLQALCARAGESWSDAVILSGHGRKLNAGKLLNLVERNRLVILFCDKINSPAHVCEKLSCLAGVNVVIGENLDSASERILTGEPEEFTAQTFSELSLMLIRNSTPYERDNIFPRDIEFARAEGVVMTNESVRSVILGRLGLRKDSVFWDIGAGTGSISISAGVMFPECGIHAVECKPDAVRVIAENARRFHLHNIEIHAGRALDVIGSLPVPDCVFVGGSGGELCGILEHIRGRDVPVRVVAACVTLETLNAAYSTLCEWRAFEAVEISVSESKPLADSVTLMRAHSPVMILSGLSK